MVAKDYCEAEDRRMRYAKAAQLLESWLNEDSDYDVRVSEQLEQLDQVKKTGGDQW